MNDWLVPLGFGAAASLATVLGGLLALRLSHRIALLLAAAAGIVLGVAFLDLLPEAIEAAGDAYPPRFVLSCTAAGFVAYLLLARTLAGAERHAAWQAHMGPASLTLHSFLDGVLMGLAFQIAPTTGWVVAIAVLTHDLADGVNTVSLSLASARHDAAPRWLVANGAAPLLGVLIGLSIALPGAVLAPLLGAFAGVFLYIGACELVPRSFARDPRMRTTVAVLAGVLLMLVMATLGH